uniref:Retrovirus-related Pol polyprotein from transposon TNT 1-94 n=1 Tax=Cajanus cajan TaxID=3821 RepID=A0A151QX42_CAJCA|nr:hypothetical protein KK1_044051 [Cajanus cajan]
MFWCNPTDTPLVVNGKLKKEDGGRKVVARNYKNLVGKFSLTNLRPNIIFATSLISWFMNNPRHFELQNKI